MASTKKSTAKTKARATRPETKAAAKRTATSATRPTSATSATRATSTTKKKAAAPRKKMAGPRADFGAPIDGFFAKQPPALAPITNALRKLIESTLPQLTASLKWGMPVYAMGGTTVCAIGAHKAHVNLILSGPPGTFADPKGRLAGEGKTGRHLKLTSIEDLPEKDVRSWLKAAARHVGAK